MPSTAVPAIEDAVVALLEGAAGLEKVTVTSEREPERETEFVYLYEATADREWSTIGPQPAGMKEDVKVFLRVFALIGTASFKPSRERAFELVEAIEDALREDPELGGTVLYQHISRITQQKITEDRRRGCHVLLTISGQARI